MATLFGLQQIRQRCTVRQDFESLLYTSDQLRLRIKLKSSLVLSYATSSAEEIGGTNSRGHFLFRSSEYGKLLKSTLVKKSVRSTVVLVENSVLASKNFGRRFLGN